MRPHHDLEKRRDPAYHLRKPARDARLLDLIYHGSATFTEAGVVFGITRERARQIYRASGLVGPLLVPRRITDTNYDTVQDLLAAIRGDPSIVTWSMASRRIGLAYRTQDCSFYQRIRHVLGRKRHTAIVRLFRMRKRAALRDKVVVALQETRRRLGRNPRSFDFQQHGSLVSLPRIYAAFPTFHDALTAAGLPRNRKTDRRYTRLHHRSPR